MGAPLHPSTRVLIAAPPHPPRVSSLSELAAARNAAQLPPTATVQLSADGPWIPVDQVLARAGFVVGAPRTRGVLVALLVVPPIWTLAHALAFGRAALFLLVLCGACVALAIAGASGARTKTSRELVADVRARPWLWRALIAGAVVCEVLALGSAGVRAIRRGHVEAAFAVANDCVFVAKWDSLSEGDLETVEPDEATRASLRRTLCEGERQKEATAVYAKTCAGVAAHLESRTFSPEDRALVTKGIPSGDAAYASGEEGAAFAERISSRSLKTADLSRMKSLPCGPAARRAYLQAVASSATAWGSLTRAGEVGDDVLDALGAEPLEKGKVIPKAEVQLADESRAALHKNAEDSATKMKSPKLSSDADVPSGLCILERRLGGEPGPACSSLASKILGLKNAEQLAEKAADARCKAALANRQRCMRGCDARQPQDELGMPAGDFDQSLDCYERCERTHPTKGCE